MPKEAKMTFPDSCKDEYEKNVINNHLVKHQEIYILIFKFLAGQEVFHLLLVFDESLNEAKMTFLIPAKMIWINFS